MELWIRSQDKMNLVRIKQININHQNKKQIIANYIPDFVGTQGEYYDLLGTYETEGRALEILDEIENLFLSKIIFNSQKIDNKFSEQFKEIDSMVVRNDDTAYIQELSSIIYKMPKE